MLYYDRFSNYKLNYYIMKKFYFLAAVITILYAGRGLLVDKLHPPQDIDSHTEVLSDTDDINIEISPQNRETYLNIEDEILICLAYVENFSSQSYFCGSKWTIGYGSTIYADGRKVQSNQNITMLDAQKCARTHLRKYVFPYIDKYVKRALTRQEIIGTSLFIYNIGPGNFKKSAFLQAVNAGEKPAECVRRMTQFTKSAGKTATGLLKREWVQGAIYCGYITPYDLLELSPCGFYNYGLNEFYSSTTRAWDGYYNIKYSEDIVKKFLQKNRSQTNRVIDII